MPGYYKGLVGFSCNCLLIFILAACSIGGSGGNNGSASSTGTTATRGGNSTTATVSATAQVGLGPESCPDAVKDPAHWDAIVGTQRSVSKVARVTCGNLTGP